MCQLILTIIFLMNAKTKHFLLKFIPLFILAATALVCYGTSVKSDFVYDDSSYIVNNHHIRSFSFIPEYFTKLSSYQGTGHEGQFKVFRPLVTLSFSIDYFLYGLNPKGFHFTNILLHFMSTVIIYCLFLKLTSNIFISLVTALIFICHPSQVEAVAWVSGRGNMLYVIFGVLSLISFLNYISTARKKHLYLNLTFFVIALLSKEMALNIIPLTILIYFYRIKSYKNSNIKRSHFITLITFQIILAVGYILYRFAVIQAVSQTNYWGNSVFTTFLTMVYVLKKYLIQIILPINHNVLPNIDLITSVLNPKFIFSFAVIFTTALICWSKKISLYIKTGILWIIFCLIPVSNIIPLRALYAERFLYLSIAGFGFIASNLIDNISYKKIRYFVSTIMLIVLSLATINTTLCWENNYDLWMSVLRYDKNNAKAHNGIGMEYLKQGKYKPAIVSFQTARSLNPNDMFILNNLAVAYNQSGDKEQALDLLKTALRSDTNKAVSNHNIALYYMDNKDYKTALPYLLESVNIDKNYANAYNSLGICYSNLKNNDDAVSCWLNAIDLMPYWEEAHYNLIIHFFKSRKKEDAEHYLQKALKNFPNSKILLDISKDL